MPTTATVLLPASIRLLPSISTDAKNKESLFETDVISIFLPFMGSSGYPSGTAYLHTVALLSKSILNSLRVPLPIELKISTISVLRIDNTFIASGSPSLALYSISFTPLAVAMNPP